jgi:hypothetical protein
MVGRTFGNVGKGFTIIVFDATRGAEKHIIGVVNVLEGEN